MTAHGPSTPPSLLVGRERELRLLRARLHASLEGRGGLVLIGGEAGIGKTAIAEALCQEAETHGALVLIGRCYDLAETPPYGPWVELFARYGQRDGMPNLPDAFAVRGAVGQVASQAVLFRQVRDFLTTLVASQPVVLLLDDLHWSDPASLDLLRSVVRDLADVPVLILATYRADELTRRHPLHQLLPAIARESDADRIDLHALDDDAVRTLVDMRYALSANDTDRLVQYLQRAEGNAFFVGELLRSLEETHALRDGEDGWQLGDLGHTVVPALLRAVIDARIARLDEASQHLLAIAAVVGHEVPLDVWSVVGETAEEALLDVAERAEVARVLVDAGQAMRFTHALVREALYVGMPGVRRRRIHRRVGEALASGHDPDPDAVAYHFQKAGDERAAAWLIKAGERAQRAYAWITAAARYETALALLSENGEDLRERGWLDYRIARLQRFSAPQQGTEHLDEAIRIAGLVGDRALDAAARFSRGLCAFSLDDPETAIRDMRAGCDALEALPRDEQMRLDLGPDADGVPTITNPRGFLIWTLACVGRLAEALAMAQVTRAGKPIPTPLAELGWAHFGDRYAALGLIHALTGHPEEAREAHRRAQSAFDEFGHSSTLTMTLTQELLFVSLPYRAERWEEHERLVAEAEGAQARASTATTGVLSARLPLLACTGQWEEARAGALAAARGRQPELGREVSRGVLGALARARGDMAEAWAQVQQVFPHGATVQPSADFVMGALAMQRLAAGLAVDAGDAKGAEAWLRAHDGLLEWSGTVLGLSEGQALWAHYHRAIGDIEMANTCAVHALQHATEPRQPLALLTAHRLLGELATDAGRYHDAAMHLAESLALADACTAPYERALTLLALAELHIAQGQTEQARNTIGDARAICESLGARPALARTDALATRLAPMHMAPPTYPAGLSEREVEVLRLLAVGKTNREIADALFLSEHTVRVHVRNILTKTNTENRTAAAIFARDRGIA